MTKLLEAVEQEQSLATSRRVEAYARSSERRSQTHAIAVPEETPVEIRLNGLPFAVMMVSPQNLLDFAYGFCLSEGLAGSAEAIDEVVLRVEQKGIVAGIRIAKDGLIARARRRGIEGRSGCGLCGVRSLNDAVREPPRVPLAAPPLSSAVDRAYNSLRPLQKLNEQTRAVHAAAWCDVNGEILAVREDVGRHNALDKLIGWRAQAENAADGFCIITSRCSFEMVTKAATAGISCLVAVSSPTGLAVDLAGESGMTLIARSRASGHAVFVAPEMANPKGHSCVN